jgi:hypothetical protein
MDETLKKAAASAKKLAEAAPTSSTPWELRWWAAAARPLAAPPTPPVSAMSWPWASQKSPGGSSTRAVRPPLHQHSGNPDGRCVRRFHLRYECTTRGPDGQGPWIEVEIVEGTEQSIQKITMDRSDDLHGGYPQSRRRPPGARDASPSRKRLRRPPAPGIVLAQLKLRRKEASAAPRRGAVRSVCKKLISGG